MMAERDLNLRLVVRKLPHRLRSVASLLSAGFRRIAIARMLNVSPATVTRDVQAIASVLRPFAGQEACREK